MVMENIQTSAKIISQGGLNSNQNHLMLSDINPGYATELMNFEPSLSGGYRRINGYLPYITGAQEVDPSGAEGPILFAGFLNGIAMVARKQKNGNTYAYYVDGGSNWVKLNTPFSLSSLGVTRIRYIKFNFNGKNKIVLVDGVNNAVVYDGTTWVKITPNTTSGFIPTETNAGGPMVLEKPSYVGFWKNTIFLSGDPLYPHIVAYSAPSLEWDWTAASGAGQLVSGFPVVQMKPFRDALYVFGKERIKSVTLNGTDFVINDVAQNIGCIASDSVVELNSDILFLSQDGVRTVSGTERIGDVELGSLSKNIQEIFREVYSGRSFKEITSIVVASKSQVRFFFNRPELGADMTRGILGGLKGVEGGTNWEWAEINGFKANATATEYIDEREITFHGDYEGNVFRQEVGSSFNGQNIIAYYTTPYLDIGDPTIRKTIRSGAVFLRPEGSLKLAWNVDFDYGINALNPAPYFTQSSGGVSNYGEVNYGDPGVIYGGASQPVQLTNLEGSFNSIRFRFSSSGQETPYSIQGLILEFTPNGRK